MEVGDAVPPLLSLCLEKKDAEVRGWRRKLLRLLYLCSQRDTAVGGR